MSKEKTSGITVGDDKTRKNLWSNTSSEARKNAIPFKFSKETLDELSKRSYSVEDEEKDKEPTMPDPRDELIRVYEKVLGFYAGGRGAWGEDENGGLTLISSDDTDTWPLGYSKIIKGGKRAREALAQGAEIKKRMEEGCK